MWHILLVLLHHTVTYCSMIGAMCPSTHRHRQMLSRAPIVPQTIQLNPTKPNYRRKPAEIRAVAVIQWEVWKWSFSRRSEVDGNRKREKKRLRNENTKAEVRVVGVRVMRASERWRCSDMSEVWCHRQQMFKGRHDWSWLSESKILDLTAAGYGVSPFIETITMFVYFKLYLILPRLYWKNPFFSSQLSLFIWW